jgi:hypothetical protein
MTAAFIPISEIAHNRRHRKRDAVTARALVVHHETDRAILCSTNGLEPRRGIDGWLPKKSITVLDASKPPFILVCAPSSLLTRKRLFGFEPAVLYRPAMLDGEWTDGEMAAWREISAAASRERLKGSKPQRNRCEYGNENA